MIHKTDNGTYVISSGGCWLPGAYDSRLAAYFAFRFSGEALQRLQDAANARGDGIITRADLNAERKRHERPDPHR